MLDTRPVYATEVPTYEYAIHRNIVLVLNIS